MDPAGGLRAPPPSATPTPPALERNFAQAFRVHGGVLDTASIGDDAYRSLLDAHRWLFRELLDQPETRSIHFDYVDNPTVNAAATVVGGTELIGMFRGTSGFTIHAFAALSMLPAAYGGFGAVQEPLGLEDVARELSSAGNRHLGFAGLCSDERIAVAQAACTVAQLFLFAHEVAHHANGHLEYLTGSLGVSALFEAAVPGSTPSEAETVERHLMELDADMSAATFSSHWWRTLHPEWNQISGTGQGCGLEPGYLWGYALSTLLRVMDLHRSPTTDAWRTHPDFDLRLRHVAQTAETWLDQSGASGASSFSDDMHEAVRDVAALWKELDLLSPGFASGHERTVQDRLAAYRPGWVELNARALQPAADGRRQRLAHDGIGRV